MCKRLTVSVLLLALGVGCDVGSTPVTPYPIPVNLDAGPVLVHVSTGDSDAGSWPALVDTMTPLTVIDTASMRTGTVPGEPRRERFDLTLFGLTENGPVPQERFEDISVLELRPCGRTQAEPCSIGMDGQLTRIHGIIGADLLARGAARFAFAARQMFLFPDITGTNEERAQECEAVFRAPFRGGGTIAIGGGEISYSGRRIALGVCMYGDETICTPAKERCPNWREGCPDPGVDPEAGLDGLFLVSTGLAITLVTESFYQRYQATFPGVPPLADLPAPTLLYLPSGPMSVRLGELRNLALVGEASFFRGPCRERFANRCMVEGGDDACRQVAYDLCQIAGNDPPNPRHPWRPFCLCSKDDEGQCRTGAVAELDGAFPVAVVSDLDLTFQVLREELRPGLPELDGILAPSALKPIVLDVDYPNNRVIVRCSPPDESPDGGPVTPVCRTSPAVNTDDLDNDFENNPQLRGCFPALEACLQDAGPT